MARERGGSRSFEKCPSCGSWNRSGDRVCSGCGEALGGASGGASRPEGAARRPATRRRPLVLLVVGVIVIALVWFGKGTWEPYVRSVRARATSPRPASAPGFEPLPEPDDPLATAAGGAASEGEGAEKEAPPPFLSDPARPPSSREIASGLDGIRDVAFSPDGRFVLTAGFGDYSVRVWSIETGTEVQGIRTHRRPTSIAVTPLSRRVLVADVYGFLRSYPWHPSGRLGWSRIHALEGVVGEEIALSPDGRLLATGVWDRGSSERTCELVLLSQLTLEPLRRTQVPGWLRRPAFSSAGRLVAAGSAGDRFMVGNTFSVWDLASGEGAAYVVPKVDPQSSTESVAFSPDGRLLATGHSDSSITIWDVAEGRLLHNYFVRDASTSCVAFSPAGDVLATAQADGSIRLWDPVSGRELAVLRGHTANVTDLRFDRTGGRLVSAAEDGRVLLWGGYGDDALATDPGQASTASPLGLPEKSPEEMTTADILQLLGKIRGMEEIPAEQRLALSESANRLGSMGEEERTAFVVTLMLAASSRQIATAMQEAFVGELGPTFGAGMAHVQGDAGRLEAWNLDQLPEVEPVAVGLRAMRGDDVELFKTIFSRRSVERLGQEGWPRTYQAFRERWRQWLGDAPGLTVHLGFQGGTERGVVFLPEPTRNLSRAGVQHSVSILEIPVVREAGRWKIEI